MALGVVVVGLRVGNRDRLHGADLHSESENRTRRRSNDTARISSVPRATSCQNELTFSSVSPLLRTAITSSPNTVPTIAPRPPARLAPPSTTAVITDNSRPLPALVDAALSWDTLISAASATHSPDSRKAMKISR